MSSRIIILSVSSWFAICDFVARPLRTARQMAPVRELLTHDWDGYIRIICYWLRHLWQLWIVSHRHQISRHAYGSFMVSLVCSGLLLEELPTVYTRVYTGNMYLARSPHFYITNINTFNSFKHSLRIEKLWICMYLMRYACDAFHNESKVIALGGNR